MKKTALVLLLTLSLFFAINVKAQEQEVVQREDLSQEIFDLERSYRGELDEYRRYEREYQLAFEQYAKLQTLSSLETLVQATHRVMTTRGLVLHTYFRLLKLTVIDAEGINVQHKERLLSRLDESIARIETHRALLEKSQNKTALQQAAVEFEPLYEYLEVISSYGQAVVQVGRLQNVYDNSVVLLNKIESEDVSELSAIELSQRQRAIEETKSSLEEVRQQLQESNSDLDEMIEREAGTFDLFYLTDIYDTLSKVVSFFTELT